MPGELPSWSQQPMIEITALCIYPVKSCRGIDMAQAEIGSRGFEHDREFVVVDRANSCLTQRTAPALATIRPSLHRNELVLTAPNAGELHVMLGGALEPAATRLVSIFGKMVVADDVGDKAAEWFGEVMRQPVRLVRMGTSFDRKAPGEGGAGGASSALYSRDISFTDAFPTLLVAEESLADLNRRLPKAILMDRFRPNIIVRGGAPYDENNWAALRGDEITFSSADACERCVITTRDQRSGEGTGPEPLRTLRTYRRARKGDGAVFGQYLLHCGRGKLRVGESLIIASRP